MTMSKEGTPPEVAFGKVVITDRGPAIRTDIYSGSEAEGNQIAEELGIEIDHSGPNVDPGLSDVDSSQRQGRSFGFSRKNWKMSNWEPRGPKPNWLEEPHD